LSKDGSCSSDQAKNRKEESLERARRYGAVEDDRRGDGLRAKGLGFEKEVTHKG
jgi:hypothetical protein